MTNETGFEQRAREVFDASVDGLDARTRSRLNQARQAATTEIERSHRAPWRMWAPAGALAAAALVAVLLWRAPGTNDAPPAQQAQVQPALGTDASGDAAEILAAGDDLDLASEDLDFYEYVAVATDDSGNGVG
jgi:NADH:ubiquinone oxidoreductase subunit 5 (subunit L)/multisubunit Na+/H+ antiporter MnhA subunit